MRRPDTAAQSTRIVVRSGATDRFAALQAAFAPEGVDVVWDRRQGERRHDDSRSATAHERRHSDRRGPMPPSWTLLDFVVVLPGRAPGGLPVPGPGAEGRPPTG